MVPHEIAAKMLAGTAVFCRLDWGWFTDMPGKLVQVVGRRLHFLTTLTFRCLSIPTMWTSPLGCLSVLTIWQLASPAVSDSRESEDGNYSVFYDLTSQGTFLRFHCILGWTGYWVILVCKRHIDTHSWPCNLQPTQGSMYTCTSLSSMTKKNIC